MRSYCLRDTVSVEETEKLLEIYGGDGWTTM